MNVINKTIFCKDNLEILRGIDSNTVDMIYLDPPFNSKKAWHAPVGSAAEGASFKDTWTSDDIKDEWVENIRAEHVELHEFLNSMRLWAQESDVAYITYMAVRIIECRRVLKETGTLWYHCDHYMNDYVKVMLDIIFGRHHDINNIVWCYMTGGVGKRTFAKKHDNIFFYAKTNKYYFNQPRQESRDKKRFNKTDLDGRKYYEKAGNRYYLDKGAAMVDYWTDLHSVRNVSKEHTGYPTQKPLSLLRRIIECSTPEDGFVLDPFCGCATTCVAAEQLGRRWAGIDVSIKAYELVKDRLKTDAPTSLFSQVPVNFTHIAPKRNSNEERERKWVYIISNDAFPGEYKVGIASNPKSRLNGYQTSDPNRGYKMLHKFETPDYLEIEKAVHSHFPNKHEWVQAELNDIVNFIKASI